MQAPASSPFGSNFMAQARGARQRLSAALSALRTATRVSERMRSDWTKFESQLLHRLCAEEELLLPAFDLAHYADATRGTRPIATCVSATKQMRRSTRRGV